MLFNLIKKDFILAKKYLLFSLVYSIGIPILYTLKVPEYRGFMVFFFTGLFFEYMMLSTVWLQEEKNKGSVLLCTTPFTRKTLVKEKYIFAITIFVLNYIIYTATALVVPIGIEKLSILNIGLSLLVIAIIVGMLIPAFYKFGVQKTRYVGFFIIFISVYLLPKGHDIAGWIYFEKILSNNIIPYLIAILIGLASMYLSIVIYSKKDL